VPAQLDETGERARQRAADNLACRGQPCQLCENVDNKVEGCAEYLVKIFELEETYRNKVNRNVLYQIIAERYNSTVHWRTVQYYGADEVERLGYRELTVAGVRRHYEQGHARSPTRTLWDLIDYQNRCIEHLQQESLWVRNVNDPGAAPQPNLANLNIMAKLNAEMRANLTLAHRLEAQDKPK